MAGRIETYGEFWPFYLREHSKRLCRALRYLGTTIALVSLGLFTVTGNVLYLLGTVVGGYAFAWAGHFFIEHNRPASSRYSLWSLCSDFRLYFLALGGRLETE